MSLSPAVSPKDEHSQHGEHYTSSNLRCLLLWPTWFFSPIRLTVNLWGESKEGCLTARIFLLLKIKKKKKMEIWPTQNVFWGLFLDILNTHIHTCEVRSGTVVHTFNPSSREAEAEGPLRLWSQPGLHSKLQDWTGQYKETPSQKVKQTNKKNNTKKM